jgi:hypothetical protein
MNFESLHYFLGIKSIEKILKIAAQCRASNQPTPYSARAKPACVRWHSGLPRGPATSSARPALSLGVSSALPFGSPCMERPGRRGHRQLATGLGVAAPMARASTRYGEPTRQHESGEGSPGRWHDGGVAERYQRDGGRRPAMLRCTPVAP